MAAGRGDVQYPWGGARLLRAVAFPDDTSPNTGQIHISILAIFLLKALISSDNDLPSNCVQRCYCKSRLTLIWSVRMLPLCSYTEDVYGFFRLLHGMLLVCRVQ